MSIQRSMNRWLVLAISTPAVACAEPAPAPRMALVPDSVLIRRGACPFECCVYREWKAETQIPVRSAPDTTADVTYTIEPGQSFLADSGEVHVIDPAIVVVLDTVRGERAHFAPGDTLVLLDYRGEGMWNVWHQGGVIEWVEQFWGEAGTGQRGALQGKYRRDWWVHVQSPREGWFRADSTVDIAGADACGG